MKSAPFKLRIVAACVLVASAAAANAQGIYSTAGPWVDDASRPVRLETLAGTYTVATMAYGACQRVCSTTLRRIEELHDLAQERHLSLNFVVFGLDPAEDKPSDWANFRADRHLAFADLQFLSGSAEATRRVANRLGVHYWRMDDHTLHDFRIVLLSPAGVVVRSINHYDDAIALLLP